MISEAINERHYSSTVNVNEMERQGGMNSKAMDQIKPWNRACVCVGVIASKEVEKLDVPPFNQKHNYNFDGV